MTEENKDTQKAAAPKEEKKLAPAIVHEAEAQRQYVRVYLPARLSIGSHEFTVADWSVHGAGFALNEKQASGLKFKVGAKYKTVIHFPMEGYEISLPVLVQVKYHDIEERRVGVVYHSLNHGQLSTLQLLVSSYINGEILASGDVIAMAGRDNMVKARKTIPDPVAEMSADELRRHRIKQGVRKSLVAFASLSLVGYIVLSLYQALFVIETKRANIVADTIVVSTPKSGRLYYEQFEPDARVDVGTPLVTIISDTENSFTLDSPCDCIVKGRMQSNNQWVMSGTGVLEMVNLQSIPYVEAFMPNEEALKLSAGRKVWLTYAGDPVAKEGVIIGIDAESRGVSEDSKLTIKPKDPIEVETVGDPVAVRIHL